MLAEYTPWPVLLVLISNVLLMIYISAIVTDKGHLRVKGTNFLR